MTSHIDLKWKFHPSDFILNAKKFTDIGTHLKSNRARWFSTFCEMSNVELELHLTRTWTSMFTSDRIKISDGLFDVTLDFIIPAPVPIRITLIVGDTYLRKMLFFIKLFLNIYNLLVTRSQYTHELYDLYENVWTVGIEVCLCTYLFWKRLCYTCYIHVVGTSTMSCKYAYSPYAIAISRSIFFILVKFTRFWSVHIL